MNNKESHGFAYDVAVFIIGGSAVVLVTAMVAVVGWGGKALFEISGNVQTIMQRMNSMDERDTNALKLQNKALFKTRHRLEATEKQLVELLEYLQAENEFADEASDAFFDLRDLKNPPPIKRMLPTPKAPVQISEEAFQRYHNDMQQKIQPKDDWRYAKGTAKK